MMPVADIGDSWSGVFTIFVRKHSVSDIDSISNERLNSSEGRASCLAVELLVV